MHMLKPPSSSLYVASFYTCILSQFWQTYPDDWSAYTMSTFITIWLIFLFCVAGSVHFIDHEYAMYNFEHFEIGNHFCEYAGEVEFQMGPWQTVQTQIRRRRTQL